MHRRERIPLIIQTLGRLAAGDADFAVFEDMTFPENYVQIADVRPGSIPYVEVTCRSWPGDRLPPLSAEQIDALAALGFGRELDPNHSGWFDWPDPACLARLIESAFMILGAAPDFDLHVARTGKWSTPKQEPATPITVHPDPCPSVHPPPPHPHP
ncbi:MAG TPA: hypothetical protein VFB58_16785 [Chloroflexota bacterium]|nr:hypothetical protein [Chloroflexota bacterium]